MGPWPVGVRTATVGTLRAEIWYPAAPGSEAGATAVRYDVREHLPASERGKIADADNPWQDCDCFADLPLDEPEVPYPVLIFVHGTASFRTQSLPNVVHWASRGFVVVAADHPGLDLRSLLEFACGQGMTPRDLDGDLAALIAALGAPADDLAFLAGHVDVSRLGLLGHSAGGGPISTRGDVAKVIVPMASGGVDPGAALEHTLVLGATDDAVVDYDDTLAAYEASAGPKTFVGIGGTGHLAFSSLCSLENEFGENILEVAQGSGVCGANLAGGLFDCRDEYIPDTTSWRIVDGVTTAILEDVLHCDDTALAIFDDLQSVYPDVAEVRTSTVP
ncbi:MAG: hypothetical protein RIT81_27130 [Deltaproteobacteria bacterium]